jgi:hypothetical protein
MRGSQLIGLKMSKKAPKTETIKTNAINQYYRYKIVVAPKIFTQNANIKIFPRLKISGRERRIFRIFIIKMNFMHEKQLSTALGENLRRISHIQLWPCLRSGEPTPPAGLNFNFEVGDPGKNLKKQRGFHFDYNLLSFIISD